MFPAHREMHRLRIAGEHLSSPSGDGQSPCTMCLSPFSLLLNEDIPSLDI